MPLPPPSPTQLKGKDTTTNGTTDDEAAPTGPLSGPSSPRWRRSRLLRLGSGDEHAPLRSDLRHQQSYGSIPRKKTKSKLNLRRGIVSLQGIHIPRGAASEASSPVNRSPISFRDSFPSFRSRTVSAYDTSNYPHAETPGEAENDVKTNGIRVWYSSFTSIDWLHDAIKDSARQARLRRRRSTRGRLRRQMDRSVGWVIVTIVGFLTAVVAFMIVRGEQWLFDLKEGYCTDAWYRSKRFCCPVVDESAARVSRPFFIRADEESCASWRTWAEAFGTVVGDSKPESVEFVAWTVIAVSTFHFASPSSPPSHSLRFSHNVGHARPDLVLPYASPYRVDLVRYAQGLWRACPDIRRAK